MGGGAAGAGVLGCSLFGVASADCAGGLLSAGVGTFVRLWTAVAGSAAEGSGAGVGSGAGPADCCGAGGGEGCFGAAEAAGFFAFSAGAVAVAAGGLSGAGRIATSVPVR